MADQSMSVKVRVMYAPRVKAALDAAAARISSLEASVAEQVTARHQRRMSYLCRGCDWVAESLAANPLASFADQHASHVSREVAKALGRKEGEPNG